MSLVTIVRDALDLIIKLPNPDMGRHCPGTPLALSFLYRDSLTKTLSPSPLIVTSGGQDWRSVQTCTLEDPPAPLLLTSGSWLPKHTWWESKQ